MTTHGGSRNRSGPPVDPSSGRSDRRGMKFLLLPAEGYTDGAPAEFPLPRIQRYLTTGTGKDRETVYDRTGSDKLRKRELQIWRDVWTTPQAKAWAQPRWRWLWPTIGEYCRLKALVEFAPDANASLVAQLHRYRDQVGLTKAGMRELGWDIAEDELAARRDAANEVSGQPEARRSSARDRIKVVGG